MRWLKFLLYNALGAALWVATWTSVGYLAGDHITTIYSAIGRYSLYALGAAVVLVALLVIRHRRRRAREQSAANQAVPVGESADARRGQR